MLWRYSVKQLKKIIERGFCSKLYKCILKETIEFVEENSLNDDLFTQIRNFPDKDTKKYMMIALSHKHLSEKYLLQLCDEECAFESFFELAAVYYTKSKYSVERLSEFLISFEKSNFSDLYGDLLNELHTDYTPDDKIKYDLIVDQIKMRH